MNKHRVAGNLHIYNVIFIVLLLGVALAACGGEVIHRAMMNL
jgi:hypothetical protein